MEKSRAEQSGANGAEPAEEAFVSKLPKGPQRFLAHAIEHSLRCGRRTAEDFIRHFPPAAIMEALADQPQLRANIIVITTGMHMKVAVKKSAESCGTDLQIAIDEDETDAETVVTLFAPDDRVRFLDNQALWAFLTEDSFWEADPTEDVEAYATAADHISFIIERALEDQLLTHREVVEGITVEKLTTLLPRPALGQIIEAALARGAKAKPFVESDLLEATPLSDLTTHVPLSWIWTEVVVPHIAETHGLAELGAEAPAEAPTSPNEETAAAASGDEELDLDVEDVLESLTETDSDEQADAKSFHVPRPKGHDSVPPGP